MKKTISLVACFAMLLASFAGCSSSTDSSSSDSSSSDSSSDSSSSDTASDSEGVEVTVMWNATETDATYDLRMELIAEYNADNDYNTTVNIECYENEQYKTKLTTLMASNSVPDVFFTWELDYLQPFVDGGKVLDITDYVTADTEWYDTFQGGVFEPLTYDDSIYAVPSAKTFTTMFYNTEIFAEYGLEVPTTYDEFIEICDTLVANDVTPISIPCPDAWIPAQFAQQLANGIDGIDIYNGLLDGTVDWNNDAFIEAGYEIQEMVDAGYFQDGFLGMTSEEGKQIFIDGDTAMYFMGFWDAGAVTADDSSIKDCVSAFTIPAADSSNDNIIVGSIDSSYAIAATCENPDEAFDFIKYMCGTYCQERMLYEGGSLPCVDFEIDSEQLSSLSVTGLELSSQAVGLTPWLDRAFGAGEGVEFNNTIQAIFGGDDVETLFDALQEYAETNAEMTE